MSFKYQSVNLKKTKGWGDLSSEELLSACLQEGIVLDGTAKKLVSNGIDGGVFLTLTEGDFLEIPFNFGERKKLQSLISIAVKEVSAKSQGFFYPYSLTRLAQRPSSLIHGFIQLNQWISKSGV